MKVAEIRELSSKELEEKLKVEQDSLSTMKLNHSISPLENSNKLKQSRKNIARIKTILNERKE